MVRIENAAEEYVSGKVKIVLLKDEDRAEDIEFNLEVTVQDKIDLMNCIREMESKDVSKRTLEDQMGVLRRIIQRSYKELSENDNWTDNVIVKYGNEILLELYFIWKFRDRKQYDAVLEAKKKMIQKFRDNPEELIKAQES